MTLSNHTQLKGITEIGDSLLMNELENNLKMFLDWGLLGIGGWFDVDLNESGPYGGNLSTLRLVNDPQYTLGQVWEGRRKDWVWETGVEYDGGQPIQITGVNVDGTYYGTGDATYGHYIDYPMGRIIFDSAISTSAVVKVPHSYRWAQIQKADSAGWFTELQYDSFRDDNQHFSVTNSGDYFICGQHRLQLPAIVLESVPTRSSESYELGNGALMVHQDVEFNVLAETRWERNQLLDIISLLQDKTIILYDSESLSGVFPLDYRGMLVANPRMYPDLTEPPYKWKKCYWQNVTVSQMETYHPRLYGGIVRVTMDIVFGNI